MNFGNAIMNAKLGKKITRVNWKNPNSYIMYESGFYNKPYFFLRVNGEMQRGWRASHDDILACDWQVVN